MWQTIKISALLIGTSLSIIIAKICRRVNLQKQKNANVAYLNLLNVTSGVKTSDVIYNGIFECPRNGFARTLCFESEMTLKHYPNVRCTYLHHLKFYSTPTLQK